jgi:hypothetical protein
VNARSVDRYLSLWTHQSPLIDTAAALRPASRVLRLAGKAHTLIPAVPRRATNGELEYVSGFLVPGSTTLDRASRIGSPSLLKQLDDLIV